MYNWFVVELNEIHTSTHVCTVCLDQSGLNWIFSVVSNLSDVLFVAQFVPVWFSLVSTGYFQSRPTCLA